MERVEVEGKGVSPLIWIMCFLFSLDTTLLTGRDSASSTDTEAAVDTEAEAEAAAADDEVAAPAPAPLHV